MNKVSKWQWQTWSKFPGMGMLALAAFVICCGSGLVVALGYRPDAALDSLALMMMKNPAGTFFRSIHYWSAQFFLVLCFLHVLDHLFRRSESAVGRGVWLLLTLVVPVIVYAMLSGFVLRADPSSTQASLVLRAMLEAVPWAGRSLSWALVGPADGFWVIFLHHVCTATILIWLVTIEHSGQILPRGQQVVWVLGPVLLLALLLVPGLQSGKASVEKGPWYLAGLQEMLHWLPGPGWAVWLGLGALALLALLPALPGPVRGKLKYGMSAGVIVYAMLSIVALGFRVEGWRFGWAGSIRAGAFRSCKTYWSPSVALLTAIVPTIDGQREGCLSCHNEMAGFGSAHDPKRIGCASCHLGERFTLNKELAHARMTLTPGNLSVIGQTCASANCHSDIDARVRDSLMATMSGVVAVDKYVFGETRDLNKRFDVRRVSQSPADTHLRTLCASCHLGQDKAEPAAIDQLSRGGGCSACHLDYGESAREELHLRKATQSSGRPPRQHPEISVRLPEQACFGCHSRSGRISLAYEGWHEIALDESSIKQRDNWQNQFRILADGRVLERHEADVHFERGMQCGDCHLASEVMGDGTSHAHKENAVKIGCVDCHPEQAPSTATFEHLDPETQKIVALRKLNEPGRRFLLARSGTNAYPNVYVGEAGQLFLTTLREGKALKPKPSTASCGRDIGGHRRLECRACHSAWSPQCISCHTSFERSGEGWDHLAGRLVTGAWQETPGEFLAEPPVLGVEQTPVAGTNQPQIGTFVPGMIMSLSRGTSGLDPGGDFHRLYAPVSPHTTVSKARGCISCHANPTALGYGRGTMIYEAKGGIGYWRFEPKFPPSSHDGLPLDAWVGFLRDPKPGSTTRANSRPLNRQEQQKILLVGACLHCHKEGEDRLKRVFNDFRQYQKYVGRQCRLPEWASATTSGSP